jgi:hypothetical protein
MHVRSPTADEAEANVRTEVVLEEQACSHRTQPASAHHGNLVTQEVSLLCKTKHNVS